MVGACSAVKNMRFHSQSVAVAILLFFYADSPSFAGGHGWGAIGGAADAMQEMSRDLAEQSFQEDLLRKQQQFELEQQRRAFEFERQRAEEERARQEEAYRQQQAIAAERKRLEDERRKLQSEREHAKVDAVHPGWRQIVRSPQFDEWFNKQPAAIQNLQNSSRAEDAIALIDAFKRDMKKTRKKKSREM